MIFSELREMIKEEIQKIKEQQPQQQQPQQQQPQQQQPQQQQQQGKQQPKMSSSELRVAQKARLKGAQTGINPKEKATIDRIETKLRAFATKKNLNQGTITPILKRFEAILDKALK